MLLAGAQRAPIFLIVVDFPGRSARVADLLFYVVPVLPVDHLPGAGVAVACKQWDVYWTSRDAQIPSGFLPLLDEWADIDARERALGIEPGMPILMDPAGRVNPRLARFLSWSRFSRLAEGTRRSYVQGLPAVLLVPSRPGQGLGPGRPRRYRRLGGVAAKVPGVPRMPAAAARSSRSLRGHRMARQPPGASCGRASCWR